jgi:Na+-translocating ferredoxin:NAD+ oxidoreductase subunit D
VAALTTPQVMGTVLLALLPGAAALCWFYGLAYLPRLAFAAALGLALEAAAWPPSGAPCAALTDGSTVVTCVLLVLALPPGTPLWVLAAAVIAAVGLGKHLYGGFGNNPVQSGRRRLCGGAGVVSHGAGHSGRCRPTASPAPPR